MSDDIFSTQDTEFMKQALALAEKGRGTTSPNPMVGALLIRNNCVVGRGYHRKAGGPHAEIEAIRDAGDRAGGSTLYVTLEPCCHYGKTPPCTDAIINSGITRVVVAMTDPNPLVNGKGIEALRSRGIEVITGVCRQQAEKLNRVFLKYISTGLPYITVKTAATLDGKIATANGSSRWVTGEEARQHVHLLRYENDAVMAGIGTVIADDPRLTCRAAGRDKKPIIRIVVDSCANIPLNARVLSDTDSNSTIVAVTDTAENARLKAIEAAGASVIVTRPDNGKVDMTELAAALGKRGITSVLVEGGGRLNASLVRQKLADRLVIFFAPKIIGGDRSISFISGAVHSSPDTMLMEDAVQLHFSEMKRFGNDVMLDYEFVK